MSQSDRRAATHQSASAPMTLSSASAAMTRQQTQQQQQAAQPPMTLSSASAAITRQQTQQTQQAQQQPMQPPMTLSSASATLSTQRQEQQQASSTSQSMSQPPAKISAKEQVFNSRRDSFIASNDLPLQKQYQSELQGPRHMSPNRPGQEVQYLDKIQRTQTMETIKEGHLESIDRTVSGLDHRYEATNSSDVIFTRRGSVEDLMMSKKHAQTQSDGSTLRTNHSTFNSGQSVANAGYLNFDGGGNLTGVQMRSGHYKPDKTSGVKMAMWAEKTGSFDPSKVPITDSRGKTVDVSHKAQVNAVNKWAKSHPKGRKE